MFNKPVLAAAAMFCFCQNIQQPTREQERLLKEFQN
jgi:hypothetical protein